MSKRLQRPLSCEAFLRFSVINDKFSGALVIPRPECLAVTAPVCVELDNADMVGIQDEAGEGIGAFDRLDVIFRCLGASNPCKRH